MRVGTTISGAHDAQNTSVRIAVRCVNVYTRCAKEGRLLGPWAGNSRGGDTSSSSTTTSSSSSSSSSRWTRRRVKWNRAGGRKTNRSIALSITKIYSLALDPDLHAPSFLIPRDTAIGTREISLPLAYR